MDATINEGSILEPPTDSQRVPVLVSLPPEFAKQVNLVVASVAAGQRKIVPALEQMVQMVMPHLAAVQSTLASFASMAEGLRLDLERARPMLLAIMRAIERVPDRTAEALRILAKHGWYLDSGMTPHQLFDWAVKFEEGHAERTHRELCEHFTGRLLEIEIDLCAEVPTRAIFFRSALAAHRRGDYVASIPLLLAQADGLCWESTNEQLYARRNGQMKLAQKVNPDNSKLTVSMLVALLEPAPISANHQERQTLTNYLNRHEVLHGQSIDYGTELNSSRAISLLVYVAWALREKDVLIGDSEAVTPSVK